MICYFPHTYLPGNRLRFLCECFPRLSVFQTSETSVSDDMRQLADRQHLNIRFPRKVKSDRLQAVLNEYTAWAGMHPKGLNDMKSFFKIHQNRPPLVEETHPTQIQSQIRQFERSRDAHSDDSRSSGDPQLQAALFLSLAHHFDTYQDTLSTELGTVREMKKQMFTRLSGDDAIDSPKETPPKPVDEWGGYMVTERIHAWATLAADDPESAWAYITTSLDVAKAVLDIFPESISLTHRRMKRCEAMGRESSCMLPEFFENIEKFAFSETLPVAEKIPMPHAVSVDPTETDVQFFLFGVPRCSPHQALARLITGETGIDEFPSSNPVVNTLFGLITGV